MNKSYVNDLRKNSNTVSDEDLKLINGYSQKELTADEIFTFSVILCDNEIDRDFERFTVDSLKALAELFVGKTAIKNHSFNSDDQSARTYKTEVVTDGERKNSLGEAYVYLKAYCYMPKLEKNADFIKEIQAGIKKEVSIGCSVKSSICSICSRDAHEEGCHHKKGRKYKGKLCYYELCEPYDAYEWSFVAVPAQKNAGVTKSFSFEQEKEMKDVIKQIRQADCDIVLSAEQASELCGVLDTLTEKAKDGETYRRGLEEETVKLFATVFPSLSSDSTQNICRQVSTEDLRALGEALRKKSETLNPPQLFGEPEAESAAVSQYRF